MFFLNVFVCVLEGGGFDGVLCCFFVCVLLFFLLGGGLLCIAHHGWDMSILAGVPFTSLRQSLLA